jgi:hypothetical protein
MSLPSSFLLGVRAERLVLWTALLASAICLVLTGCPTKLDSGANFDPTGESNALAFDALDVYGRDVSVGRPRPAVMVLFFSGQGTSDAMQPITADIAVRFHDQSAIDFVTIVDLRSLSFYERPFADGAVASAGDRTVRRVNRQLEQEGLPPIEGLHDHMYLVTDPSGDITTRYGVPDPNQTLTCIIYDPNGMEIGRFDPATELDGVMAAIEQSLSMLPTGESPSGEVSAQ